jgi:hypothetical protein
MTVVTKDITLQSEGNCAIIDIIQTCPESAASL